MYPLMKITRFHCNGSGNTVMVVFGDENDACFNAVEAGITKVITATYPVMKTTRVSFKWKLEY